MFLLHSRQFLDRFIHLAIRVRIHSLQNLAQLRRGHSRSAIRQNSQRLAHSPHQSSRLSIIFFETTAKYFRHRFINVRHQAHVTLAQRVHRRFTVASKLRVTRRFKQIPTRFTPRLQSRQTYFAFLHRSTTFQNLPLKREQNVVAFPNRPFPLVHEHLLLHLLRRSRQRFQALLPRVAPDARQRNNPRFHATQPFQNL